MAQRRGKVEVLPERCPAVVEPEFHHEIGVAGPGISVHQLMVDAIERRTDTIGNCRFAQTRHKAGQAERLHSGFLRGRIKNGPGPDRPLAQARETIPDHADVRGGDYYSDDQGATP